MGNLVFTQLSIPEIKQLFRQELESYFANNQTQSQPADQNKLLTIQEAATFLTLSVPTIYGLVNRSAIPYSKPGKRLYFSKQELTDWIKSGRKKTTAEIEAEATNYVHRKGR